jgi:pimeloyl-ACP methyl ester carboxylesterase
VTAGTAVIDGIATAYEVVGEGPPLLLFAPGGFNATMANWRHQGIYKVVKPLDHLSRHYTCITFDRREAGASGGRVEHITWGHYVRQGLGLLDHLGIERAHAMGGCQGCAPLAALVTTNPQRVLSAVFWWPTGGARYRIRNHEQFAAHLAYVEANGLQAVIDLARSHAEGFSKDPRIGPWGPVLRHDDAFAAAFAAQDPARYRLAAHATVRGLIDRDTALGAEPEDLMRVDVPTLIVPGNDASHATSAARYLQECLPGADYWDVPVAAQTERSAAPRLLQFLAAATP